MEVSCARSFGELGEGPHEKGQVFGFYVCEECLPESSLPSWTQGPSGVLCLLTSLTAPR